MSLQKQRLFSIAKYCCKSEELFLNDVIRTSTSRRFHSPRREANSSLCCFFRVKSRTKSLSSVCVIRCGFSTVTVYGTKESPLDSDSSELIVSVLSRSNGA